MKRFSYSKMNLQKYCWLLSTSNCKISANLNVFGKPNWQKQACPKLCHRGTDERARREESLIRLLRVRRIFVLLFVCGS